MHRLNRDERRELWLVIAVTGLAEVPPAILLGWAWRADDLGWGILATVVLVPVMVVILMTGSFLLHELRREQRER